MRRPTHLKRKYSSGDWVQVRHNNIMFYARLLGMEFNSDALAIFMYEEESRISEWAVLPIEIINGKDFRIRKLSYKEENMLPSLVRLKSYVFNNEWIRYGNTNFDIVDIWYYIIV